MIQIRDFSLKKCFFQDKEGKKRMMIHKSIILSEDSIIRFDKKNNLWKFSSKRLDSKVATSLQLRAQTISLENARETTDTESYSTFEKFSLRMIPLLGIENLMKIITFLK